MNILVDYDNFEYNNRAEARKGLLFLAEKLLNHATRNTSIVSSKITIRLYGGWYSNHTPTKKAQALVTEITHNFPTVLVYTDSANLLRKIMVTVELAYSLKISPGKHLFNTFRYRETPTSLVCKNPSDIGCTKPDCPMLSVFNLLTTGSCCLPGCRVKINDLLFKGEQKLVDTMMALDAVYISSVSAYPVCFVTSDDDFWPAILTLLVSGKKVVHIHTIHGRRTARHYSGGYSQDYSEANF